MLTVELTNLARVLKAISISNSTQASQAKSFASDATTWSNRIKIAIAKYGHAIDGSFAYEVNGLGSQYLMDDANVPSLLSLPYLGFLGGWEFFISYESFGVCSHCPSSQQTRVIHFTKRLSLD